MARPKSPRPPKPDDPKFSPREEQLAGLLAAGWKVGAACSEVGVSDRQGYVWRQRPGFDDLVARLRSEMFAEALGRLANLTSRAVDALEKVLDAEATPAAVLVSAARGVLADAINLRASVETEARLADLERRLPRGKR